MNDRQLTPSAIYGEAIAGRAQTVYKALLSVGIGLNRSSWDLGELLEEATANDYFGAWGFANRKDFLSQHLDISDRQANYLTRVVSASKALNIDRNEVERIQFSKLREIMSLDTAEFEDDIRRLLAIAPQTPLAEIIAEVKRLKGIDASEELTWVNFQVSRIVKDNVVLPALDAFRNYLGSKGIAGPDGSTEYSDGTVLELICAEILSSSPSGESQDFIDEVVVGEDEYVQQD